ncbi:Formate hydrogenlyase subunit 3/Multisubunit Na+/H+ antiporter, MnhD subunit [Humidesulfovibrio mexicanus]|uniref:Formate hydrogenlyase subunit 3/Multisubunit Na+/H+ antiporter, MnhD subunit n=1 Tax=Humidesulfovibrio mexicanus TaxID=147047 RepID=A0A238YFA7_9BACT|nr:proton-conducting transporter membrane subunit [Humidesulfovibrio mexicanus]SNR69827.1 Formate hydrogenlyase subunit 3/Multisubunit Na+/H+ antiporter, MnhD subunit [Humidesulfovibrio mexicanus]
MQLTYAQYAMSAGALIALVSEVLAFRSLKELKRLTAYSACAQLGYALVGVGSGEPVGTLGAALQLLYQAAARAVWFLCLRRLAAEQGDSSLAALAGTGARRPGLALLLGFSMFTAIGLTPFTAPPGKEFLLLAAVQKGSLLVALALAAAGIFAALYTVRVVHAVCLKKGVEPEPKSAYFAGVGVGGLLLAGALALACLFSGPLTGLLAGLLQGRVDGSTAAAGHVAGLADWPLPVMIAYLGAFALFAIVRFAPKLRGLAALVLAAATLGAVMAAPVAGSAIEPLRQFFTLLFAMGGGLIVVYSIGYMDGQEGEDRYSFFLFLLFASLIGLASATEAAAFYSCFEIMTFSSYMLVVHKRTDESLAAGAQYLVMCVGGAGAMQVGLLALTVTGTPDVLGSMAVALSAYSPATVAGVALMVLAGFTVKAGFFPLHAWLPAAHPVAPSSISAPLSGLLTKVGVFGVALVVSALASTPLAGGYGQWVLWLLTAMAAATFILGELMALAQQDIKRMLAYSTLAQIGEIGLVLSLGTFAATAGALAHVLNHAVMKDLLFLAAGGIILRAGSQRLGDLAGMGKAMPFTGVCMAVGLVSIMGLPPMGGFFSKFLMLKAALDAGQPWMAALILVGGLIGCIYYGRIIKVLFFSKYEGAAVAPLPLTMGLAIGALAALALCSGVFPTQWVALILPAAGALFPAGGALPDISIHWSGAAVLPLAGAALAILLRRNLKAVGAAATLSLVLALGWAIAGAGFPTDLQRYFALLVLALGALNVAYSAGYMSHSHSPWRFFAVFLTMISGLVGMTTVGSLVAFFCFWEIMSSWPLFFAIIHEETPSALKEGTKYFLFNIAGASFLFLGVLLLGHGCGGYDFEVVARAVASSPAGVWLPGICLMGVGMLMKAAMLPVRIDWQMHPATAPTPVSGYISAMLLKSGPFGIMLLRFVLAQGASGDAAQALDTAMYVGAWIGGVTILYAGVQALLQTGIKEMLIYSTVSQLGYVVLGVCLGTSLGVTGGLLHLFNHMLFKDLAFLCAGALMFASHAHNLEELGGMGRKMPITFLCFSAALFSAAGMPPFNGFNSKLVIYYALIERGELVLAIIAILSSVITLAYFLKFMHGAFFGQLTPAAERATEVGPAMRLPIMILGGLCLLTGVFPGLALIPLAGLEQTLGITPPQVGLTGIVSGYGAMNMTLLSFMLLAVGGGVWLGVARLTARRVRRTAIHTCGETSVDQRLTRISAGDLYAAPIKLLAGLSKGHFSLKRLGGQHD